MVLAPDTAVLALSRPLQLSSPIASPSPLQLAPPLPPRGSVALAVLAYLAIALVVFGAVRWRARLYYVDPAGDADTALHLRRLRRAGLLSGWLVTVVVTFVLGVGTVVQFALRGHVPGPAAFAVGSVAAYLLPAVPVALAARLATVPYRRAVRGLRLRYRDVAAWELERDGVGLVGVLAAATVIALVPSGWPRVLTAVGLGLVATALAPFALVVALRTRLPTDEERATLDGVLAGTRLRVVDDQTRVGSAFAVGIVPGARYVFLTESLFDTLDAAGEGRGVA